MRKDRLKQLIEAEKTTAAFSRKHGFDPNYLSQMLTGARNIGEKTARKIEAATGKPAGWLDDAAEIGKLTEPESRLIELYRRAPYESRVAIEMVLRTILMAGAGLGKQEAQNEKPEFMGVERRRR